MSIKESAIHEYSPINSLDNTTSLEFMSPGYNDKFKDLSYIMLKLQLQLVKKNGDSYAATDLSQPHLVSNILHTIFKSAYLSLNGITVRAVDNCYGYKEFIETTLNFGIEAATSRLAAQGYVPNAEAATLKDMTENSKVVEFYGKINLCNISKLLLPGVSLALRLNMETPDFFIMEGVTTADNVETVTESKLVIHKAKLFIRHVVPSNDIIATHEKILTSGIPAIYEYRRSEVFSFHIAKGTGESTKKKFFFLIQS